MDADALVRDYLGRLETAASRLGVGRRAELAGEVREHIATAMVEAGRRDELTVRNILERLGPPEDIVAAETEPGVDTSPHVARSRWGAIEIAALLLLTVGAVLLPIIGPIIGLMLVWLSAQWTRREKLVATAIAVELLVVPFLLVLGTGAGAAPVSGEASQGVPHVV